jgi:release factor glutamine methyltransferase
MATWRELLDAESGVSPDLLRWWLSDRLETGLMSLPLDREAPAEETAAFEAASRRLAAGEPVQYVCGRAPFRDLMLQVDRRVLIPRPETEQLVQIALDRVIRTGDRVLDVGTGSGCIALAVKHERPGCRVEGRDLSEDALEVARANAEACRLEVAFRQADLLSSEAPASWEVILSNPPYIADREELPSNVRDHEPGSALFSGPDGLNAIRCLLVQAWNVLAPGGRMLLETGETQHAVIEVEAQSLGWQTESLQDLAGRDRFVLLRTLD